jgi:hypothetical protein
VATQCKWGDRLIAGMHYWREIRIREDFRFAFASGEKYPLAAIAKDYLVRLDALLMG